MNTKKFKFNADKLELLSDKLHESDKLSREAHSLRGGVKNWCEVIIIIIIIIYE
jgi:hypothetical protein